MCGICGKVSFKEDVVERVVIERMCQMLLHRGPDDEGIHTALHIGLGQRRLSIIDLDSRAVAPLANEDKTIWVTFNGEIYNFQELRAELVEKGHIFRTATDTEVIVHLYEEYGTECLAKMRGMFAFALWDSNQKRLFAARDRLGKKPFFYTRTSTSFIFGSEIRAVIADPEVSVSPSFSAIDQYLTYQYVPSPLTAFTGIFKLPPAHFIICEANGKMEVQRYWSPPLLEKTKASQAEIEVELLRLLKEAVRLRLISDVPLGAFLSGGIDSAAVVALMALESSKPVKTFSIGFEEENHNELPYAKLLAQQYHTEHHEFIVKPDATEILPLLVKHYGEPFADSSALPTYYVSKMTRQHVTVALSGDGSDENFSGYEHYAQVVQWAKADRIPWFIRRGIFGGISVLLDRLPYYNLSARVSRASYMLGTRLPERYLLQITTLKGQERRACYTHKFNSLIGGELLTESLTGLPWKESMDMLDWMMRHDQNFYLPDCLMVKTDIASMMNSLEVRCPFMDHKLIEFTATIPSAMKRNGTSEGKLILKSVMKELLPSQILKKRKTGFGVPLAKWFREDLSGFLRAMLLDSTASQRGLFEQRLVNRMVEEHVRGQRDWSNRLWAFLCLEMWFREFID